MRMTALRLTGVALVMCGQTVSPLRIIELFFCLPGDRLFFRASSSSFGGV